MKDPFLVYSQDNVSVVVHEENIKYVIGSVGEKSKIKDSPEKSTNVKWDNCSYLYKKSWFRRVHRVYSKWSQYNWEFHFFPEDFGFLPKIQIEPKPNTITVVFSNNTTTPHDYIPYTPWMMAHRMLHGINQHEFLNKDWGWNLYKEDHKDYIKEFTMKSARDGILKWDTKPELFAQYVFCKDLVFKTFNPEELKKEIIGFFDSYMKYASMNIIYICGNVFAFNKERNFSYSLKNDQIFTQTKRMFYKHINGKY